jgi:molecular chaperone DnaJ
VLSDETRRKEYDEARALFGSGVRFPSGGTTGTGPGGPAFDLGDLFGNVGGGLGDVLGGVFNRRTTTTQRPRRGADVETETTLSFSDALSGVTVPLRTTTSEPCPDCAGTGARRGTVPRVCEVCTGTGTTTRNQGGFAFSEPCRNCKGRGLVVDDPCPTCSGSGRALSSRTMQTRIPAGVRDGQRIKLKGKGAPGERGGPAGDLFVQVHVKPHPVFGRKDDNLTVTVPVTFPEATLGAEVKVPTLGGAPVTVRVPPGTANGRTFRVRGKGATRRDGSKGDLLVTVEVAVPQKVDDKAREALEQFAAQTSAEDPRGALLELARRE